jgi:hypothetical protein
MTVCPDASVFLQMFGRRQPFYRFRPLMNPYGERTSRQNRCGAVLAL